ncbi:MAG: hypothetical protein NVS2B7_04700 [Herpetosiphon sp.]
MSLTPAVGLLTYRRFAEIHGQYDAMAEFSQASLVIFNLVWNTGLINDVGLYTARWRTT